MYANRLTVGDDRRCRWSAAAPVSGRLIDGSSRDATVADVFTVRDGRPVRMQAYADPAEVLGADS